MTKTASLDNHVRRLLLLPLLGLLTALLVSSACGTTVTNIGDDDTSGGSGPGGGGVGGGGSGGVPGLEASNKIDVLLVVDNSRSMADKQEVLTHAVSGFVQQLSELAIVDVHIGVVSSSLGGHGADACSEVTIPSENDGAHLLTRSGTGTGDPPVPTYQGLGFLLFDPTQQSSPPGDPDPLSVSAALSTIVKGAGEVGCGYEATLEAWYRFLVDPDPYETITVDNFSTAVLNGTDQVLLQQRAQFLRPDSQLLIVILSDENDCSTRDGGQFFFANQIFADAMPYHLPKPRAACASDPNSPCCRSCGQAPGDGCSEANDDCAGSLSNDDDNINLRCFDQKRRFGIDFLWPIDRYTQGLSAAQVADRHGNVVANPVFSDLSASGTPTRSSNLVQVLSIVGVPWQDVARDISSNSAGVMSGEELVSSGRWDVILGDPANYVPPQDPFMVESVELRSGSNPITGDPMSPPGGTLNPINGSEYTISCNAKMPPCNHDLQYACIFALPAPRDCTDPLQVSCDCQSPTNDSPLCSNAGMGSTLQVNAKAYPGIRHLSFTKSLGARAAVGSICPAQVTNATLPSFGYRGAFATLFEGVSARLAP